MRFALLVLASILNILQAEDEILGCTNNVPVCTIIMRDRCYQPGKCRTYCGVVMVCEFSRKRPPSVEQLKYCDCIRCPQSPWLNCCECKCRKPFWNLRACEKSEYMNPE